LKVDWGKETKLQERSTGPRGGNVKGSVGEIQLQNLLWKTPAKRRTLRTTGRRIVPRKRRLHYLEKPVGQRRRAGGERVTMKKGVKDRD